MRRDERRARLIQYLDEATRKPFRPGEHDCALFAAGAIEAQTGIDLAAGFRGYKTIEEGMARLVDLGFTDLATFASAHLREIAPSFAGDGDIGAIEIEGGETALAVVSGAHLIVVALSGAGILPRSRMARAWSAAEVL